MDEARVGRVARPGQDAEAHGHENVSQLGRGEERAEEGARVVREGPEEQQQLLLALERHERAGEVGALYSK